MSDYDLLKLVEYGGCSAKLPARDLEIALAGLSSAKHPDLLVGAETHDDAGVYRISADTALIQTTDFFPPVCSDPFEFGQIAAANALSDVFAMGGEVLTALNLVMFPADAPLLALREMLQGGEEKLIEAGGLMVGGHTIVDDIPKYGLAVTGTVHPEKIITNAAAQEGDVLILAKPLGTGIVLAGHRLGEVSKQQHQTVLDSMKQLNRAASRIMQQFNIHCATDITGFGLAGHALKIAMASKVCLNIEASKIPVFQGVASLADLGCIPGACFRNMEYVGDRLEVAQTVSYENKMICLDAQTSGGLLICCPESNAMALTRQLKGEGYEAACIIGQVQKKTDTMSVCLQ